MKHIIVVGISAFFAVNLIVRSSGRTSLKEMQQRLVRCSSSQLLKHFSRSGGYIEYCNLCLCECCVVVLSTVKLEQEKYGALPLMHMLYVAL